MAELTITEQEDLKINIAPKPKEKTNKDFMQIYLNGMDYVIQLIEKSPTAAQIYLLMMKFAEANNTVELDIQTIMEILNIKRKATVIDSLKLLKDEGYVIIYKHGRVNFYFINPEIAASCDARYKKKISQAYGDALIQNVNNNKLIDIDKNIVNTSIYDQKDRAKLKISFYNKHKELQKPTDEELAEQAKIDEYIDSHGTKENLEKEFEEEMDKHISERPVTPPRAPVMPPEIESPMMPPQTPPEGCDAPEDDPFCMHQN